jgi:ABC-type Fe3+-hydroxamate transport system substrate-binding protein
MFIYSEKIPVVKIYSRIISLVPSITELLYYIDLEEEVLANTKFCVHPAKWRKTKTRIGGTKNVNIDLIKKLNPDLIIANKEENVREQVELLSKDFDIFVSDVNNLNDAINMIRIVGTLTGKGASALQLCNQIHIDFKRLADKIVLKPKIKTGYLIWRNPYMTVGGDTFINDMMMYCGMENIYGDNKRYPKIDLKELIIKKCELLILSSEPYPFKEKHVNEIQSLMPGIKILLANGEMFSWYGSRLLKATNYFENIQKNICF